MFTKLQRETVSILDAGLVKTSYLNEEKQAPLVISPEQDVEIDIIKWLKAKVDYVEDKILKHGAILFRGFKIDSVDKLEQFSKALRTELVEYLERRSPRTDLAEKVYSSTVHPADQYIHFHNTNSFAHQWPMKLWFCCIQPAEVDGRTPIADCRRVYQIMNPTLRDKFVEKGVMYRQNFYDGMGLSWQTTYQTTEKSGVADYCRKAGIDFEWIDGERLRTRQVRHAVVKHPKTGELSWFNQAHHFHVLSLEKEVSHLLLDTYKEEDLPRNAYFGDGQPITPMELDEITECYEREKISFPWEQGDVLMLENMLMAHSRTPFKGERLIALTLADMYSPSYHGGGVA